MNREDIIRMAKEAGLEQDGDNFFSKTYEEMDVHINDLERFAALVASSEREACANVAEKYGYDNFCGKTTDPISKAIRARGRDAA